MSSNKVMLKWPSSDFYVTDEGYELLKQLIAAHQVCPSCGNRIDQADHLLVGRSCLACVLKTNAEITFVGLQRVDSEGNKIYAFTNAKGITLTSKENSSDKPQEDVALSIEQAGFTIPTTYKPFKSDQEVTLGRYGWEVYGNLAQSVVVLHHKEYQSLKGNVTVDFIAYKHGNTIEFNKRTTEHKNMLEKARSLAERTKKNGHYHLNGNLYRELYDSHVFEIIARLESAVYDAQLAFLITTTPQAETVEVSEQTIPETGEGTQPEEVLPSVTKGKLRIVKQEQTSDEQSTTETD